MNRQQAINRLGLGRELAAEVRPEKNGNRAYVFIDPVVDPSVGRYEKKSEFSERIAVRIQEQGALINAYILKYRELRSGFENVPDDWDMYRYSSYEHEFSSLEDLEKELHTKWQLKIENLRLPHDVDHPF